MKKIPILMMIVAMSQTQCTNPEPKQAQQEPKQQKKVVYQMFTRLFGNKQTLNKPWGTSAENGVGKFNDITDRALEELKLFGATHIWYTGVPHHAMVADYKKYGISDDFPQVVKGRAGSPYAVKDYYNVDPDLAEHPAQRMQEFEQLVQRTHKHGLKVILDIVPNHVARRYESISAPDGVRGFGQDDDTSVVFHPDNNFYYVPGEAFKLPVFPADYQPLGGDPNPLLNEPFVENPAKWTGNGSRKAQPDFHDWYETVKINFGIDPDGNKHFPSLPQGIEKEGYEAHYQFWKDQKVPNSWQKFKDIALFWLSKGVDGFRYDMAEMVPVEFWSYMNSHIKHANPNAFLLAEVYNPNLYRDYIFKGQIDYLYDKVQLYDTLRAIIQHKAPTNAISQVQNELSDISSHMLHFLENHDEQRIASPEFAADPFRALPAMVVSATIDNAPIMVYFGQEVGEPGAENAGFGSPSRTSIFDYVGVPQHQKWVNNGKFDGGQLSEQQKKLRDYYQRILHLNVQGNFHEVHQFNLQNTEFYNNEVYAFIRGDKNTDKHLIISNFSDKQAFGFTLLVPREVIQALGLKNGRYNLTDELFGDKMLLKVEDGVGKVRIDVKPLDSFVLKVDYFKEN